MFKQLMSGNRMALSKAITLVESIRPEHKEQAVTLLNQITPSTSSLRIAISGAPGAGKSSFCESMGKFILNKHPERKLAVLAIDPSSSLVGGSILGDKTRMIELAKHQRAFIRPSPSSGTLGGVTRTTNDVIRLCEAAGYNTTFVETVGVGQSEIHANAMVDMFILLVPPGAGDELQGIKKGIVEMADLVVVHKFDSDLKPIATKVAQEYRSAIRLQRPKRKHWDTTVRLCSSHTLEGIPEVWEEILNFEKAMRSNHEFEKQRLDQNTHQMECNIQDELVSQFNQWDKKHQATARYKSLLLNRKTSPHIAAKQVINEFFASPNA